MAYDEGLAQRIREMIEERPGGSEKRMFGGLCFLLRDHMIAGVVGSELMVRVGAGAYREALSRPHAREMDFTGRALTGFVYVGEDGIAEDEDLRAWLEQGIAHAEGLPPKQPKTSRPKPVTKSAARANEAAKKKAAKKKAAKKKAAKKKAAKKKPAARSTGARRR